MADLWRVTYMGEGVKPTEVGAFAKHVTAYTSEDFARSVAGEDGWIVADPSGNDVGSKKPEKKHEPKQEPKTEDKKHDPKAEKAEDKKHPEKHAEKPAEKAAEKK